MASTSSTRSESPVDIDFSVIRTSIKMGHKMIDQILNGIHYGSEEVRNLLREECDFILECKVCRNLFRSFPNFVAHKRVYCMEYYEEKVGHDDLAPVPADEETVVIQPEAPEESNVINKGEIAKPRNATVANSNIEKAINKTFDGKSKEYQFYTKVAEDLEKRKLTKVTNTVTLTPLATTANAVKVAHAKGDRSGEVTQGSSPKKQSPVKSSDASQTASPVKKKNSVMSVCVELAKKKVLQEGKVLTTSAANALPLSTRLSSRSSARSRKSSPRKSIEYLDTNSGNSNDNKSVDTEEDMDLSEWNDDNSSDDGKVGSGNASDKEWLKFCDVKNSRCIVCKRSFSSLYNLKFHAKMKHVRSVAKYACPNCELSFGYISSLARHLRRVHHKPESYINNIKMKLHRRKSTEDMEIDQDDSSSSSSGANPSSPRKETKNMLSFSTGWKKCDKCGKVCWKAKSFYRHYNTCKGPATKPNSKSASNSPVKPGKQINGNGNQKNSTALLKLQEKLRAGVIQSSSTENVTKAKLRDKKSAERSVESKAVSTPELYKALTRPLLSESDESRSRHSTPDLKEISSSKTYNLRLTSQVIDQDVKESVAVSRDLGKVESKEKEETDKLKEVQANNGSPAFKKLEERLVREAGLSDSQKTEKIVEVPIKPYGTRHASQVKSNTTEANEVPVDETKEVTGRIRKPSSDSGKEDNSTKMKEQRALRESPEIKQLEEKLTREVIVKPYGTRHAIASQIKSNVSEAKEVPVIETKDSTGRIRKLSSEIEKEDNSTKVKEQRTIRETPEIKQLEDKLTRDVIVKPYGTRHASQIKSNAPEGKEAPVIESKEITGRVRKLSNDIGNEDSLAKVKEQRVLRESPEIKQLEEKLTREALGQNKQTDDKEPNKNVHDKEEIRLSEDTKSLCKETVELKETYKPDTNDVSKEAEMVETRKCSKRTSSREAEIRKERISEKLREKMACQEYAVQARSSRSLSTESDTKSDKNENKTPEKMQLMTNLSPVSSPGRTSILPASPTPSLQSNSGDSYNMKFKMTVQEMAELVESASLTKFAKERKKRARNILNTKQVKESQKTAAALSKPMKKRVKTRNIVVRNVYGTRNKKPGSVATEENINVHSTRFSGGKSKEVGLNVTDISPKSSAEGNISSRDSSRERQVEMRRLSREQKRLQNSAGFVEKNFYAVSQSRDSSKDSQSDVDNEKRKASRERKRLESSQGFVDKGLYYESDSSVEKERRSLNKLDASDVAKERIKVEKSSAEHVISKQHNVSTSTSAIQLKSPALTTEENVPNESNEQENEKSNEKIKQKNTLSVKKTVLYVGKDFTEKIKSIQQRKSDVKPKTLNTEASRSRISETDTELKSEKHSEKSQIEQLKFPKTLVEKTKVALPKANVAAENQTDELSKASVDSKQNPSETDSQNELRDSPKHRTRLATGSIFFDSELLKMSPSKAEKKVAELSKATDPNKEKLEKGGKSGNQLTLVKKKLSLSPKKEPVETVSLHQRTTSGPQRYSLSTGVKQCQKCNKTFWKKRAYVFHLINSRCSDKKKSKVDRKRALSLSPDGNMLEANFGSGKGSSKKAKREVGITEKTTEKHVNVKNINDDINSKTPEVNEKEVQKVIRKPASSLVNTSEIIKADNKELNEQLKKEKTREVEGNENKRNLRTSTSKEKIEKSEVVKEDSSSKKSVAEKVSEDNVELVESKKNQNVTELSVKSVSTVGKDIKSEVENFMEDDGKLRSHKDANIGRTSRAVEAGISKDSDRSQNEQIDMKSKSLEKETVENIQRTGAETVDAGNSERENVGSQVNRAESMEIEKESGPKPDLPKIQVGPATVDELLCKDEDLSSSKDIMPVTMVTDEIPGPSTSLSSVLSEDSDDNDSDFSGFSEDDLKVGEQELSQMDLEENNDLEDDVEDIGSDDDLGELSDEPCSDEETELDLKPNNQSASTSQRPIRKSAQNRFSHVEEIWVYKEPGKPIVEKTKGVKNREYVIDVTNPSKLQCHNSKDVDRLIDEKGLKCRQCETPCTSISNLRRHVIRHLGWKRYKCKHCPYTCYDMSYCRQHVLRAHGENLTNKNFNKFITDLKKEATKKRAAKRTSTLHKSKQNSIEEDAYKKPKTLGINSAAGQKVNSDQSKSITPSVSGQKPNTSQGSNSKASNVKESRKTSDTDGKSVKEPNKVALADFIAKIEGTDVPTVKKETVTSERKEKTGSPLDRARMNLAKALNEK